MTAALDLIGDRWTLLIIRELLGGPARFNELQRGLPSIAKNLLSSRLQTLEADGLIRKITDGTTLYALTELGAGVRPIIDQLGRWGAGVTRVGPAIHTRSVRSIAVALQAILSRPGVELPSPGHRIELDIDGKPLEVVLSRPCHVTAHPSTNADARATITADAMRDYLAGRGLPASNLIHQSGNQDATAALMAALTGR